MSEREAQGIPLIDVELLADAEKWFDEDGWKAIPGFPPSDPALEYEQKAAAMLARLSSESSPVEDEP